MGSKSIYDSQNPSHNFIYCTNYPENHMFLNFDKKIF